MRWVYLKGYKTAGYYSSRPALGEFWLAVLAGLAQSRTVLNLMAPFC